MVDIPRTLGALLVGGLVASTFSGIVTVQSSIYFKHYTADPWGVKILVAIVWSLDIFHTIFVDVTLWDYLILHFGDPEKVDSISWSLPLTIAFTAVLTFLVHCFFIHRIHKFSRNNLLISIPLGAIACLRLCFACLTTVKMITLGSLKVFVERYTAVVIHLGSRPVVPCGYPHNWPPLLHVNDWTEERLKCEPYSRFINSLCI